MLPAFINCSYYLGLLDSKIHRLFSNLILYRSFGSYKDGYLNSLSINFKGLVKSIE